MKSLCLHSLVILLLQTHVKSQEPCGERNVSGAVGGAVTLHVTHTGDGRMFWTFGEKGEIIASGKPGGTLEIEDKKYEGKLSSSSDGSLTITNLQHEDQGTYRAQARNLDCSYHLSVFNVKSQEPCGERNVTGAVGGAAYLRFNGKGIKNIVWSFGENFVNFATIIPGRATIITDEKYDGRLSSSSDGSLTITNVIEEDQGIYRAQFTKNIIQYCSYHLSVFRGITPKADYTMVNVIRLGISGCVLLITCCIFIHHMKTEVITQRPETDSI